MITDKHLQIFQRKIYELNTAIFTSQSDSVLKIPTSIISILKVDDIAQLWFFIPKPLQSISEFEKTFISKVDFFRKGADFFVEILGMAYIVHDPEEINGLVDVADDIKHKALHESVLIKVRLLNVRYFESKKKSNTSPVKKIRETLHKMLFNDHETNRPYHLPTDTFAY